MPSYRPTRSRPPGGLRSSTRTSTLSRRSRTHGGSPSRASATSSSNRSLETCIPARSHVGDELLHPLIHRLERVLAQDRALGLVVQLQVHPVDRVVAALLLGHPDELPAQPG